MMDRTVLAWMPLTALLLLWADSAPCAAARTFRRAVGPTYGERGRTEGAVAAGRQSRAGYPGRSAAAVGIARFGALARFGAGRQRRRAGRRRRAGQRRRDR